MSAPAAALWRRVSLLSLAVVAACTAFPSLAAAGVRAAGPNDPYYQSARWAFDRAGFAGAWSTSLGDPTVAIAVVDSGVDPGSPDLQGALLPGYDFYEGDADASDPFGHGTEVASVAAARTNNGVGIAGACGRCSILPVRVSGPDGFASVAKIAAGIVWAADQHARVINVSLVTEQPSAVLASAVAYAQAKGALVVAAAGNDALGAPGYPAALPGVISVEATTRTDAPYAFSNYGSAVTLGAPGCAFAAMRNGTYTSACGTSIAAPLVAGAAGILAASHPEANADQLAAALEHGADRVGDTKYGRLNVARSLQLLGGSPPPRKPRR